MHLVLLLYACDRSIRARARVRLAAYLKWLEDRARRRREYERYLAALAAQRARDGGLSEQVKQKTLFCIFRS